MLREIKTVCRQLDAELDRVGVATVKLSPQARAHLRECDRCRMLYGHFAGEFPAGTLAPELEGEIVHRLQGSLNPVARLRSTPGITTEMAIAFLLLSAGVIVSRRSVAGVEAMNIPQLIGISAVLFFGLALLAFSLAWHMRPGSLRRVSESASIWIPGAGLVIAINLLFPWQASGGGFVVRGWHCMQIGLALAVAAALLFAGLVRRGAILHPGTVGGTVGAMGGLLAVTVLQYTCDLQNTGHLLVWHFGVFVLSTLGGALIGKAAGRLDTRFH